MEAHLKPELPPPPFGLVLAGGRSRRMGRDKGALEYQALPHARYTAIVLSLYCERVFFSCREDQASEPLFSDWPKIFDASPGVGPLGGLLSALRSLAWKEVEDLETPESDPIALFETLKARYGFPLERSHVHLALEDPGCGAVAVFEGCVRNRNHGRDVGALEYEAHEILARREGEEILREARQRFGLTKIAGVHRLGLLSIGETAVWIGPAHRGAAFAACAYAIDEIKRRVPIRKKEHFLDGSAEWSEAGECCRHPHGEAH